MSEAQGWADPDAPVTLTASAKLTRSLRVVGTRPDGLHLLEAEMVSLEWGDVVHLGPGEGLEVTDEMPPGWSSAVPEGPDNLVLRALGAAGRRARVRLVKRVPPGSGLGGGSADAAAVLRWAGWGRAEWDLARAAALGADVAFCLHGGRARVSGVGEVVRPLPPVGLEVTLLLVPIPVSTPAVYRRWDALGGPRSGREAGNDLEAAALAEEPRLAPWRSAWGEATGSEPRLAGSGSTWFVEQARPDLAGSFPAPGGEGPPGYVVVTRTDRP